MSNITKVYLMNVLMEKDYAHTMYFADPSAQQSYFNSRKLSAMTFTDFSYQRKDQVMRIPKHIDSLYAAGVNYAMYQNAEYGNKWFYAFITDMKYVNDGNTDVFIKTDCMQTWMFDITVKHSFVEREHASSDKIGEHTLDEGLEIGEYITRSVVEDGELEKCVYIINTTAWTSTVNAGDDYPLAVNMGGIFYAGGAYICDTMLEVVNIIKALDGNSKSDAVVSVYMVPKKVVNNTSGSLQFSGQNDPIEYTKTIGKPMKIGTYEPHNNKLMVYPYTYLLLSNNSGVSNVYKYELFSDSSCEFLIKGIPVVGGSIKACPKHYKNATVNEEEGIMCGKFPTLSWSNDQFTNWLTQNSVNIALGIASSAAQVVGGLATMAVTGGAGAAIGGAGVVSGVQGIASTMAQVHQQSFTPASARGNTNGGDINTASKSNKFYFYSMTIKEETARVIDNFFDMFGYKCCRVKIPNKAHRKYYWYTKLRDANIAGGIPQNDLQEIKDCYNRGITFWNTETYYRNYSIAHDNIIV